MMSGNKRGETSPQQWPPAGVDWYYFDDSVAIACADCRVILPTLEPVDLVLTDPPFGKGYHDGGVSGRKSDKWRSAPDGARWPVTIEGDGAPDTSSVPLMFAALADDRACYLFSQWMVEPVWLEALTAAGFVVRNRLVWTKPTHGAGDLATTYGPQHETIFFASKGRHELRGRRDGDVWLESFGPDGCFRKGKQHPTEKPIPLLSWLVSKSSDAGGIILDPFMGSGTTLRAAKDLGRKAIGIELEERYAEIAAKRMAQEVLF